jgi:dTDP-4-amino-4,6-dideoxygalactose transaminase
LALKCALASYKSKEPPVVLVPTYNFASDAEVARYEGLEVVFVDSVKDGFNIDPEALEDAAKALDAGKTVHGVRGRPIAVFPVHFGGLPCSIDEVSSTAARYGMAVIEDCAHAFPAKFPDGRPTGTAGDFGVFSFYATKTITTGEGGMLVTKNAEAVKTASMLRLHGISRPVWDRYTDSHASPFYDIAAPGYKYNLTDIAASIGRVQLGRAGFLRGERQKLASRYDAAFKEAPQMELPPTAAGDAARSAYHLYPLRVRDKAQRGSLMETLQEANIGISVHFRPLHTMTYWKDRYGLHDEDYPNALDAFQREISLPLWPGMSAEQQDYVIETILTWTRHG